MGRYTGSVCRMCRREGVKLFLKGQRCFSPKCAIDKRNFPPGQHGQMRIKLSDYGIQLREKQKARRIYGVFERQFRRYFQHAQKNPGVTGQMLLQQLERRIDNVMYRIGFATSRAEGRQMVHHRGVHVNGKSIDVPSHLVKIGDVIQIHEHEAGWVARVKQNIEQTKDRPAPAWLQIDAKALKAVVSRLPEKDDVGLPIQEQLIVELYSK